MGARLRVFLTREQDRTLLNLKAEENWRSDSGFGINCIIVKNVWISAVCDRYTPTRKCLTDGYSTSYTPISTARNNQVI